MLAHEFIFEHMPLVTEAGTSLGSQMAEFSRPWGSLLNPLPHTRDPGCAPGVRRATLKSGTFLRQGLAHCQCIAMVHPALDLSAPAGVAGSPSQGAVFSAQVHAQLVDSHSTTVWRPISHISALHAALRISLNAAFSARDAKRHEQAKRVGTQHHPGKKG